MASFLKIISSIRNALRGVIHAYRVDQSFRMETWGGLFFVLFAFFLFPLSGLETMLLTIAYGLILITELVNTSVEQLLERLHPEHHELIGRSKDIAAGAVLMAFVIAGVIVCSLLLDRFGLWRL